ncbi:agmatinase [Thermodesulfatator autotrophicus]|uniref:Agmatinase n=1 Tax=Thermodesulfatator autotrophicus TaxID=1795632 RepID=A0A177EA57_9BACT|nr:agmatinase [Thermodesulfatator autotrophicus]OAG28626.1 hypothetical protein TH606_00570 [Thermodesulfatator autotrophicus]
MTFLGLPENPEKAKIVFLPAPYDATTSFLPGARFGPRRILEASPYLEFYDEETDCEVYQKAPFLTLPEEDLPLAPEQMLEELKRRLEPHLEKNLFPIVLGGEHTVSLAPIELLARKYPNLCVVQIDAHADLRDFYQGSRYSHACTMRRALELSVELFPVGIRAISREEMDFVREKGLEIFWAKEVVANPYSMVQKISHTIGLRPVYVTIDLDGFDPSEVPGVGTPEPGGLKWYDGLLILRELAKLNVVGFDVVELLPIDNRSAFFAAKLIYKFLSYLYSKA